MRSRMPTTSEPNGKRLSPRLMALGPLTGRTQTRRMPNRSSERAELLAWFRKLEAALEEVERTTKKGLTQARFGLGPVVRRVVFPRPVKHGEGAPPRDDRRGFVNPVKIW